MATATVTIRNLTQTQRAAIRRNVARRNERMWDDETRVSVERDRIEQLRHGQLNIELAKALIAGMAGDAELEAAR